MRRENPSPPSFLPRAEITRREEEGEKALHNRGEEREMTSSPFFSPCDLSSRHFEQKGERGRKEKNAGNRSHSAISKRESRPIRNKTAHNASPTQPNPHRFLSPLIERPSLPVLFSCRWHRLRLFSGSETGGKQKRKEKGEVVVGPFSETIKWCLDLLLLLFSLPLLSLPQKRQPETNSTSLSPPPPPLPFLPK